MSKPKSETWWCEKDERGNLVYWTVAKSKKDAIFYHNAVPSRVVRIRVTEIKEKP